ncbi:MAG: acyl-CoA dehydrogenase family protein [Actinomycetota bacterium]
MTDSTDSRFHVDDLLRDSATNLFASTCGFDAVQAAEGVGWAPEIWDAVAGAGFTRIGLPEEADGSGGSLLDAAEVLRIAGSYAAPIPLAETSMLGGWLLTTAGLALPDGPVTVAPGVAEDSIGVTGNDDGSVTVTGSAGRVPWAAQADIVVLVADVDGVPTVVAIDPNADGVTTDGTTNVAGEPRPTVSVDSVTVPADRVVAMTDRPNLAEGLRLRGALTRTMLMAGALDAMSRLTVEYTDQRQQFGRPVSRFQAVQQHLVWGAQDAAIANMTAQVAAAKAADGVLAARFEIAAARTVANECASTATRWAHQAHGAMGMTQEYALHHLSRRLWAWRHEYNTPGEWASIVGGMAEAAGPDGLYPLIAS